MSSIMQFNSLRIDIEEMSKITGIDRRTVYKAMDRWTENDQKDREEKEKRDQSLRDRLDKAKTIEEIDAILDVCPMGAHELLDGLRSKRHAIWLKRLRATHDKNEILILYSLTENEQDKHYAIQKLAWFFEVK